MIEHTGGRGASATIHCQSCGAKRPMNEAQGEAGRAKLPQVPRSVAAPGCLCRRGCTKATRLMLVGASNLWFPAYQSIIVMPRLNPADRARDDARRIAVALGEKIAYSAQLDVVRDLFEGKLDVTAMSDAELRELLDLAQAPPSRRSPVTPGGPIGTRSICLSRNGVTSSRSPQGSSTKTPSVASPCRPVPSMPVCRPPSAGCWPSTGCAR